MIYLLGATPHPEVTNLNTIKINFLHFTCSDDFDAIVCTSKQAIYSLENSNIKWQNIPVYAIGEGTKQAVFQQGGEVAYVAKSAYGDEFANELIDKLKGKKVLFVHAKKVVSELENILKKAEIKIESIVGYETTCSDLSGVKLAKNSIFIFTSPSTIKCFFSQFEWDEKSFAICIGEKSASFLPSYVRHEVSKIQSISHCVKLAKEINATLSKK